MSSISFFFLSYINRFYSVGDVCRKHTSTMNEYSSFSASSRSSSSFPYNHGWNTTRTSRNRSMKTKRTRKGGGSEGEMLANLGWANYELTSEKTKNSMMTWSKNEKKKKGKEKKNRKRKIVVLDDDHDNSSSSDSDFISVE